MSEPAPPTALRSPRRRTIGLRWIVAGTAALSTAAIVLAVGAFGERNAREALSREIRARVLLDARNLALAGAGALLSEFPELTLTPLLAELGRGQDEIAFATVTDLDGTVIGHADARSIGTTYLPPVGLVPVAGGEVLAPDERVAANDDVLVASVPVRHPGTGDPLGAVHVAIRRAYVDGLLAEARREQLLFTAVLLVAGVAIVLLLMSSLLRPLGALRAGLERIGRGDLQTPVHLRDRTELGLLAETINDMASRIREAQRESLERERLAREVELAREIQSSLLPAGDVRSGDLVVTGAQRAAAEVGGDFWDVHELPDGRIGVAVADVAGKGLGGCLVASMLSALLGSFRRTIGSPKELLVRLEEDLRGSLRPGTFITMFYGIVDPRTGRLVFASAGHSPLLVRRADGRCEWYRTKGIPLGALRGGFLERSLSDEFVDLGPGDLAVQYTDGVNEAFREGDQVQFGFDRIAEAARAGDGRDAAAVVRAIHGRVETWVGDQPPSDDETIVVIARDGVKSSGAPPPEILARAKAVGCRVRLPAEETALTGILPRLGPCPGLDALEPREVHVLESALYEVCANIAEHGLGGRADGEIELYWVPRHADGKDDGKSAERLAGESGPLGTFVVVDRGAPFRPKEESGVDFGDPRVRRKGRGLGLEILRAAMHRVAYHPGTTAGNVTVLEFDPHAIRAGGGIA